MAVGPVVAPPEHRQLTRLQQRLTAVTEDYERQLDQLRRAIADRDAVIRELLVATTGTDTWLK